MKLLVLGAGLQGCACAYDLLQNPAVTQVTLADLEPDKLPKFLRATGRAGFAPLSSTSPTARGRACRVPRARRR